VYNKSKMSGALEKVSQFSGDASVPEHWPNTPEGSLERWVHFDDGSEKDIVPIVYGTEDLVITEEMRKSLVDMTFPVAAIAKWTRKGLSSGITREPAMIAIDTADIAAHLAAFGNGHSHIAEEWPKSSRVYVAAQHMGVLVFDVEPGIIPIPSDTIEK
jgi:hypothetical protein